MPVPEAPINKQSEPVFGEYQVRSARQINAVNAEAMACSM